MRLFPRRPSHGGDPGTAPPGGLEVIRRIKVTIDRYWVTTHTQADPPERPPRQTVEAAAEGFAKEEDPAP